MVMLLQKEKEDNAELLEKMELELKRMDRKELLNEQARIEQNDNVERRIEYERHKNQKIQREIEGEQAKITAINDKYKDRLATMQGKYEDMEKDLKFA